VEYSHHEVAPSQHEIDLRYDEALVMADKVMTYRTTVKEIARQNGVYATFMPKPVFGQNGSGMHVHQSLFKGSKNAFFDGRDKYNLSKIAKHYIAGIMTMPPRSPRSATMDQLLQAACSWIRSPGLCLLGAPESLRHDSCPDVQAG